jgi:hypothetical protein
LLTFDGTEDGINDGSLNLVGMDKGNFDSSLDPDGTDDGSLDLDGTADGNVEGLFDFDGTEDGIVIAVFDRKTRPPSEPSSILKSKPSRQLNYCPKEHTIIRTFGTGY